MRTFTVAMSLMFAISALAADKKPLGMTYNGSLQSVEAGKITITLPSPDKNTKPEAKTLAIGENVKVLIADVLEKNAKLPEGKLADLKPGTLISIALDTDNKKVETITARGPNLRAGVKSVDAKKRTITIYTKDDKGKVEQSIVLGEKAKILLNDGLSKDSKDKEGKLEDLTEGMSIAVQMSVDRKTALQIRPSGKSYRGVLKGIDAGTKRVLITIKGENGEEELTFLYDEGAKIDTNLTGGTTVSVRTSVFDKDKIVELNEIK